MIHPNTRRLVAPLATVYSILEFRIIHGTWKIVSQAVFVEVILMIELSTIIFELLEPELFIQANVLQRMILFCMVLHCELFR